MSHETLPISPAAFAEALKDLPITTLHLKAAELRNSIAHLDYSNEQLLPFTTGSEPDQDCVEAIQENEIVIKRMLERIELLKKEVEENRGASWREFESKEEVEAKALVNGDAGPSVVNGEANGTTEGHEAWRDGTFQTGRIVNGQVTLNETGDAPANGRGGRLDDETLRRAMEERMREDAEDDDGMHL